VNWDDYHVLILPDTYGSAIGSGELDTIKEWVRSGGTLIAVGNANNDLAGKDGFSLKRKERDNEESEDPEDRLQKYGEASRERAQYFNPGSIFEISMDTSHPLAFGYEEKYMSLKLGSSAFDYLENGWNVGVAKPGAHRSGFVGNKAKESLEHTLAFGVQDMGAGHVVYMIDNPLFRGFWHNGKLLFGNAVFFVGN
jgi:hypothetical protein